MFVFVPRQHGVEPAALLVECARDREAGWYAHMPVRDIAAMRSRMMRCAVRATFGALAAAEHHVGEIADRPLTMMRLEVEERDALRKRNVGVYYCWRWRSFAGAWPVPHLLGSCMCGI